jgi:hypothetical protein
MNEFIDLQGASGVSYRFRTWPAGGDHPPIAGNFAIVRFEPEGMKLLALGQSLDLSLQPPEWTKLKSDDAALFTRLNVARAAREAEYEDLVARHKPTRRRQAAA